MDLDLPIHLEEYLLQRPRWVPIAEICEAFGIDERALRAHGRKRPLLHHCAISSAKPGENGLKHIRHTTVAERLAYKHQRKRVLIASARALKDLNAAIAHALSGSYPHRTDGHGHRLLPL